ncbi:unnamed protein product, partial [marine sediment metagenome]
TPFSPSVQTTFLANYFPLNQGLKLLMSMFFKCIFSVHIFCAGEFLIITPDMLRDSQDNSRFVVRNISDCWLDRRDGTGEIVDTFISYFDQVEVDRLLIVLQDDGSTQQCSFTLESNGVVESGQYLFFYYASTYDFCVFLCVSQRGL